MTTLSLIMEEVMHQDISQQNLKRNQQLVQPESHQYPHLEELPLKDKTIRSETMKSLGRFQIQERKKEGTPQPSSTVSIQMESDLILNLSKCLNGMSLIRTRMFPLMTLRNSKTARRHCKKQCYYLFSYQTISREFADLGKEC